MLIIANGNHFGKAMIPMVGIGLFMRAGLANLGSPADSSLSMMLAPKNLRPAFTSVVNFIAGIVSIISGHFTGSILLRHRKDTGQPIILPPVYISLLRL